MNVQSPKQVQSPQILDSMQPQQLPFVDMPLAPAKNYPADNTSSPSMQEMMSKSLNRRGVKQSSLESSSASTSTGNQDPFVGTVKKWDTTGATVKTHPIAPSVNNQDTYR